MGPGLDDWARRDTWVDEFVATLVAEQPFSERIGIGGGRRTTARSPVGPVVVEDVVTDAKAFNRQAGLLAASDHLYPCVEAPPTPIPVNLESLTETTDSYPDLELKLLSARTASMGVEIRGHPVEAARQFFGSGLRRFVRIRVDAAGRRSDRSTIADFPESDDAIGVDTVAFTVHTVSTGLRTYYSPAYLFNASTVFGSDLSTPVSGELEPGLYIFGAGAPGEKPVFDVYAKHDVPPATSAHLGN